MRDSSRAPTCVGHPGQRDRAGDLEPVGGTDMTEKRTYHWKDRRDRRRSSYLVMMVYLSFLGAILPTGQAVGVSTVTRACAISSDHPYWNSEDLSWPVGEMGATALRLNFSRLEVEDGYDFVILNSTYGEAKITGSYSTGLWSDWVSGTSWTLRLLSDRYNTAYGFDCVAYEILVSRSYDIFWYTGFLALVAIVVFLVIFEVHARKKPTCAPRKGAQAPRHPY